MTLNRKALSAFVQRCLDPLPDAVLIDTHHNQLVRKARGDNWRKARFVTGLAKAEGDYFFAKSLHAKWVLKDAGAGAEFFRQYQHCVEKVAAGDCRADPRTCPRSPRCPVEACGG